MGPLGHIEGGRIDVVKCLKILPMSEGKAQVCMHGIVRGSFRCGRGERRICVCAWKHP